MHRNEAPRRRTGMASYILARFKLTILYVFKNIAYLEFCKIKILVTIYPRLSLVKAARLQSFIKATEVLCEKSIYKHNLAYRRLEEYCCSLQFFFLIPYIKGARSLSTNFPIAQVKNYARNFDISCMGFSALFYFCISI